MRIPILAVCAAVVAACSFPTDACGCSPAAPLFAVAIGTITQADGSPIAGVVVDGRGTRGSCPGSGEVVSRAYGQSSRVSDSSGQYRVSLGFDDYLLSDTTCMRFSATRTVGSDSTVFYAAAVSVFIGFEPHDSVRVDFRLP